MRNKKSEYPVGKNPNSLSNLIHEGRPSAKDIYGEPKKKRTLSVTESGWQMTARYIKSLGYSSVSEYLEDLGRKQENASA